jgi:hypothetical protein
MATKASDTIQAAMALCGLTGSTWSSWRVVAKVLDGLPLDAEDQRLYEQCTGRTRPPVEPPGEFYAICGRRSGKSRLASVLAIRAASRRYQLAPGERAIVGVAASDRACGASCVVTVSARLRVVTRDATRSAALVAFAALSGLR